ncbi:MAG: PhzF family phenazine biosynthesis protein [Acidobacteriota bacterium]|nr:PhzF family phenazine biosynthesis protein [Acidobacteriota bacterium]
MSFAGSHPDAEGRGAEDRGAGWPQTGGVPYALADVFAEQPLSGNPLAIVTDARSLSSAAMQAVARETNLSETTFILPRSPALEAERGVQVRIFTVAEELPFAGHPTLGTASWLHWNHPRLQGAPRITLDLPVGPIVVEFRAQEGGRPGVFATMQQQDPVFGNCFTSTQDRETVAALLGLQPEAIAADLPMQIVSTGMAFCIVPLRSLAAAAQVQLRGREAALWLRQHGAMFFYCITPAAAQSGADWHARMQFYNGEDPATGSAAGCAIAYLVQHGAVASECSTVIEQGIEMGRPSRIYVQARRTHDTVRNVRVGGRTIPVASGRLFL